MIEGFDGDGYITAYPIYDYDSHYYAFAKTWYANEMDRDGAVWTHTLLIEHSDLNKIDDAKILLPLFQRPNMNDRSFYKYNSSIEVSLHHTTVKPENFTCQQVSQIIEPLYTRDKPIFLLSHSKNDYETLIFEIWNQQSPILRKSFAFCTGSLTNREVSGRSFHLQVISYRLQKFIEHSEPIGLILDIGPPLQKKGIIVDQSTVIHKSSPAWVEFLSNDIISPFIENNHFRGFLLNYHRYDSKELLHYVELYLVIEKVKDTTNVIKMLLVELRSRGSFKSSPSLFTRFFNLAIDILKKDYHYKIDETALIDLFVSNQYQNLFDPNVLKISNRAKQLYFNNKSFTIKVLSGIDCTKFNPVTKSYVYGIIEAVLEKEASEKYEKKVQLFKNLLIFLKDNTSNDTDILTDIRFYISLNVKNKKSIINTIAVLNEFFPGVKQRKQLKKKYLGRSIDRTYFENKKEFIFLYAFAKCRSVNAFDKEDLCIIERLRENWLNFPDSDKEKIISQTKLKLNPFAELMYDEIMILNDMHEEESLDIDEKQDDFIKTDTKSEGTNNSDPTHKAKTYQEKKEISENNQHFSDDRQSSSKIVNNRDAIKQNLEQSNGRIINTQGIARVLTMKNPSHHEIISFIKSVRPTDKALRDIPLDKWEQFLFTINNSNIDNKGEVMTFFLALAWNKNVQNPERLIPKSFESTYLSVSHKKPNQYLIDLKAHFPANSKLPRLVSTGQEYFKNLVRLRYGLLKKFIDNKWNRQCFIDSISNKLIYKKIFNDDIRNHELYKKYIEELAYFIRDNPKAIEVEEKLKKRLLKIIKKKK